MKYQYLFFDAITHGSLDHWYSVKFTFDIALASSVPT
jgi:hypothetical protein